MDVTPQSSTSLGRKGIRLKRKPERSGYYVHLYIQRGAGIAQSV